MLLWRPSPALAPFVECLWCSTGVVRGRAPRERVLPTGLADLVFFAGAPLRVLDASEGAQSFGRAVLSGAGSTYFVRDTSQPGSALGAHFRPGGAAALLGLDAGELRDRHVELEALWGGAARELHERLLAPPTPHARLAGLQAELERRAARASPPSARWPAIALSLRELERDPRAADVERAWRASGFSRRHFSALFERVVGLTPKRFARVRRFHAVLQKAVLRSRPARPSWTALALDGGFYDQAHLIRDFQEFAGLAPGAYRPLSARQPSHVPLG